MDTDQKDFLSQNQNLAIGDNPPESQYPPAVDQFSQDTPAGVPPVSDEPTVVMPASQPATPILFYAVFLITIAVFLTISYLLFQSYSSKKELKQSMAVLPTLRPTATPIVLTPTVTPTPVDTAVVGMRTVKESDTVADLSITVNETDVSSLEESLKVLDTLAAPVTAR